MFAENVIFQVGVAGETTIALAARELGRHTATIPFVLSKVPLVHETFVAIVTNEYLTVHMEIRI